MEDYIYIGKIVNTHGLKGEIRIISDFERKDLVFIKGMPIYIGRKKEKEVINSYRHHKNFEMITMDGYYDINEVLRYKGLYVYIKRSDLKLKDNDYLETDLLDFDVLLNNNIIGKVKDITDAGSNNKILIIKTNSKEVFIPYQKEFIKEVNINKKYIIIDVIEGMI